jgi:hypothetical protein
MKIRLFYVMILLGMVSCGEKSNSSSLAEAVELAESNGLFEAAKAYEGKLNELLTLEMAAKTMGFPAEDADVDYNTTMSNPSFHAINYTWDRGRTRPMTVANMTIQVPDLDRLELSGIQEISKNEFEFQYRVLTPEEIQESNQLMKDALQDRVTKGEITQEQADLAGGLGDGLVGNQIREIVSNVGQAATWMPEDGSLYVYQGGLMFRLTINQGEDAQILKEKLIKLASEIINKL